MNERAPGQSKKEAIPEKSVSISQWAEENGRDSLLNYIRSARVLNDRMGIDPNQVEYDTKLRMVRFETQFQEVYRGYTSEETGLSQGGVALLLLDTTSGALAMTVGEPDDMPVHAIVSAEYPKPLLDLPAPLIISSRIEEPTAEELAKNKRAMVIVSEITQAGDVCVRTRSILTRMTGPAAKRIIQGRVREVESYLANQESSEG